MKYKTGLWKKVSEKGTHYCTGKVKIGTTNYKIILFSNENKKTEKSPDFNLILEDELIVPENNKQEEITPENKSSIPSDDDFAAFGDQIEFDEDIPF